MLQAVADKLGIDPSKLQEAFKQVRSQQSQGTQSQGDQRQNFLNAVAAKLGIDPEKLQQAFPASCSAAWPVVHRSTIVITITAGRPRRRSFISRSGNPSVQVQVNAGILSTLLPKLHGRKWHA